MQSPYAKIPASRWAKKTEALLAGYPLAMEELVDIVRSC